MSPTVLVVDDDPVVRAILESILSSDGYRVLTAAGADEAVTELHRSRPEVVLVDRIMPGRDGVRLCRDIRADGALAAQPALVLLTADADRVTADLAGSAGIDAVLAKSGDPAALLALMARLAR